MSSPMKRKKVESIPPHYVLINLTFIILFYSYIFSILFSAWDQSDKFVKIFVALKNVQTVEAANVFCEFTNRLVFFFSTSLMCSFNGVCTPC